jgi:hypothetical protein
MTTRSDSFKERSTSQPVRNTTEGEGLGGTTDEESDNSSPYEVEDGQGTGNREHDAGFDTNDGITDSYESTVNSLASLQLSNAAAITATSEELSPPGPAASGWGGSDCADFARRWCTSSACGFCLAGRSKFDGRRFATDWSTTHYLSSSKTIIKIYVR